MLYLCHFGDHLIVILSTDPMSERPFGETCMYYNCTESMLHVVHFMCCVTVTRQLHDIVSTCMSMKNDSFGKIHCRHDFIMHNAHRRISTSYTLLSMYNAETQVGSLT